MLVNLYLPETLCNSQSGFLKGTYNISQNECSIMVAGLEEEMTMDNQIGIISSEDTFDIKNKKIWIKLILSPSLTIDKLYYNNELIKISNLNLVYYNHDIIIQSHFFLKSCEYNSEPCNLLTQIPSIIPCPIPKSLSDKMLSQLYFLFIIVSNIISKIMPALSANLCKKSCFLSTVVVRLKHVKEICESCVNQHNNLLILRILGIIFTDMALGLIVICILSYYEVFNEMQEYLRYATQTLATSVQELLLQLKGAPAGLKLNQPLTQAYAEFFSYIVNLWMVYLDRASLFLGLLANFLKYIGIFGISLQAAMFADIMNLVVLQIYCVYVYAARIHMVQISLLASEWRAFCGLKWNPLKQRVDKTEDLQQKPFRKVITAFIFTLVVFLLPTTTVYYAVFVVIRLALASVHGMIKMFIWLVNYNPIYLVGLTLCHSSKIKGELHYEIAKGNNQQLVLRMDIRPSSLSKVIQATHSNVHFPPFPTFSLAKLISQVIYAQELI